METRFVTIVLALGFVCGGAPPISARPADGEPRVRYDAPIYPGDVVEPRLEELLPSDAAEYASRYRICIHWSGEEAYDGERGEEIAKGIEASCAGLEVRRDSLRFKYPPGSPVDSALRRVIADLDSFSDRYVWEDPSHESRALDRYCEAGAQRTVKRIDDLIAQRRALSDSASVGTRNRIRVMTANQTAFLREMFANIDRLHPETAAEIRAARVRWEKETGERVGRE